MFCACRHHYTTVLTALLQVMTVKYQEEMDNLKKNMTVKLQKKKEGK